MTKKYYEILEVSETATQKEIKKAYQKLSLKWHPDRQNGKSLEEKKQANEKMQEINKAYEILGDEEKRKRYDLGDTDFTFSSGYNYSYEEELGNINDELKRLREEQKILARKDVINMVGFEMLITEIFPRKLDSSLWAPYNHWQEKVWGIKIEYDDTNEYGIDTSELDKFKETMIDAIRKRKEELKNGINNPQVDQTRKNAIESIERELKEKRLNAKDLGEYSNYQEQINSLPKVWQINSLRDKIKDYIYWKSNKNIENDEEYEKTENFSSSDSKKHSENKIQGLSRETFEKDETPTNNDKKFILPRKKTNKSNEYDNWDRESLIKKIKELEEEISELKKEKPETPEETIEYQSYVNEKEAKLQEYKSLLNNDSNEQKPISNNKFPTEIFIGGGVIITSFFLIAFLVRKRKKH